MPCRFQDMRLIEYEVVSFSFFLLSSLVATTIKVHLNIYGEDDFKKPFLKVYRRVMLLMVTGGLILGSIFLVLSMIDVIQIQLEKLSCGSPNTVRAVTSLVSILGVAFIIHVPAMMLPIFVSMTLE